MPNPSLLILAAAAELCRPWASQTAQLLVNSLWLRAYTQCLNSDELPSIPKDWQAALDRLKPGPVILPSEEPGSVPATGPAKAAKVEVTDPAKPGEPLCLAHHKTTVYSGRHWRCK